MRRQRSPFDVAATSFDLTPYGSTFCVQISRLENFNCPVFYSPIAFHGKRVGYIEFSMLFTQHDQAVFQATKLHSEDFQVPAGSEIYSLHSNSLLKECPDVP